MFYEIISWQDVEVMVAEGECIIIDVRSREDYDRWHVKDAVNVEVDSITDYVRDIYENTKIVLYCERGGRSFRAARLIEQEYNSRYKLYVVSGGIKGYKYH